MDAPGEYAPDVSSVRSARLFVVDQLQEWGHDELVDNAALITSELATNAIVHTRQAFSVRVHQQEPGIRVEVFDHSPEMPQIRQPSRVPDHSGEVGAVGRSTDVSDLFSGLRMVDAIATRWGAEPVPDDGKVVWFELAAHPTEIRGARMSDLRDLRHHEPVPNGEAAWESFTAPTLDGPGGRHFATRVSESPVAEERSAEIAEGRPRGGALRWVLLALAAVALGLGAFLLLGGDADVDVDGDLEVPEIDVNIDPPGGSSDSEQAPAGETDATVG